MNTGRAITTSLILCGAVLFCAASALAAVTVDRDYRLGDDSSEGAVAGNPVSTTFDSAGNPGAGELVDLTAVNTPTYVTITGRPDGVGGRGIQFAAAQQEYLHGFNLGTPSNSFSAATHTTPTGGTLNYAGLVNRGFQFWVQPSSTAVQSIVMDTNQHGVRINSTGKFSMRYAGLDFESSVAVVPGTWYHVEVVRPLGAAGGSRMYINGNAAAAAAGGYNDDWADLVVGSNTAGDDGGTHASIPSPVGFTGGTNEYFSGIVDDLKMFVIGSSTGTVVNYGTFDLKTDNQFIASTVTGLKGIAGDVNNNGTLEAGDKTAFIAGWLKKRTVNGIQLGDLTSYGQGDLNLDGITNIQDLLLMQNAIGGSGIGAITAAELSGVPEPATISLLVLAMLALPRRFQRRA